MMNSRVALMLAAALGMGSAFAGTAPQSMQIEKATLQAAQPRRSKRRSMFGDLVGGYSRQRRSGPGWTDRHVQRMARKRRNQARHRAVVRRRSRV